MVGAGLGLGHAFGELFRCDNVGEGAGGCAVLQARVGKDCAFGIGGLEKRRAFGLQRCGVVKFVGFEGRVPWAAERFQVAVAEVEFALGKAGFKGQEARHLVRVAFCIDECFAEGHVAAAFTIGGGGGAQAFEEGFVCGKCACVQFWIAAWEEDEIAIGRGLVCEGGEGLDFGPLRVPALQQVGVGERESGVGGDGYALGWWRQQSGGLLGRCLGFGERHQCLYVDVLRYDISGLVQKSVEVGVFCGLHQAEVS